MKKLVLSVMTAAALAGSAYTIAIAAPDGPPPPDGPGGPHARIEPGFILDAKLAGMKAALKLTPEQDKLWPAFEAAVRDGQRERREAMRAEREAREDGERPSPIAVMTEMSERMAKTSEALKKVAEAAKPLYDGFDDVQKRHFGPLLRMLRDGGGPPPHGGPGGEHGPMEPKPL